jgi:hypothetical protein
MPLASDAIGVLSPSIVVISSPSCINAQAGIHAPVVHMHRQARIALVATFVP